MKTKLLFVALLGLSLFSCKDDTKPDLRVSSPNVTLPFEYSSTEIKIGSNQPWTASTTADWCHLSRTGAAGNSLLRIEVDGNIGGARTATVMLKSYNEHKEFVVTQEGKAPTQELVYRLPVVFHVLYSNPNDTLQNIPYKDIVRALNETNELYANAGPNSAKMNVEFILAKTDPQGNVLPEPGVERIHWSTRTMSAPAFMGEDGKKYLDLIWDPNKYINIALYNFENPQILGISTFPLVPANHPMVYLDKSPKPVLTLKDLKKVRCVSINSIYMGKPKGNMLDVGPTLAHELGHYLGLRHVFSEASNNLVKCQDTDGCLDTPSYDKQEYDQTINYIFQKLRTDSTFKKTFNPQSVFDRHECYGGKFISRDLMDYDFCHKNLFTEDQKRIVRHVLTYSPFMPGPKIIDANTRALVNTSNSDTLPHTTSNCPPSLAVKYYKILGK